MTLLNGTMEDEMAVFRACLSYMDTGSRQVICTMTMGQERVDPSYLLMRLPFLAESTVADYVAKNKDRHLIYPDAILSGQLDSLSFGELKQILSAEGGGWDQFRKLYPESHGIVTFSRVGFDSGITQALILVGQQFDLFAGFGHDLFCVKTRQGWNISEKLLARIS